MDKWTLVRHVRSPMSTPISPPPVTKGGRGDLPAYLSNGLVGIRVLDIPLLPGVVLVNGFSGLHPTAQVESTAQAPYPLAGDIAIDGVWLGAAPNQSNFVDQRYDFSNGELTTRFTYTARGMTADVEVLTFCSQKQPTLVLQEVAVTLHAGAQLSLRAIVDIGKVSGRVAQRKAGVFGRHTETPDGSLAWEPVGGQSLCGIAYVTEFLGDPDVEPQVLDWGQESGLSTEVVLDARPGKRLSPAPDHESGPELNALGSRRRSDETGLPCSSERV